MGDDNRQASHNMEEDTSSDRKRALPSEGMSRNSMLESLHNVERRVDQPQKKMKRLEEVPENSSKPSTSYVHRGTGVIGQYMRPDSESVENNQPSISGAVDLTIGRLGNHFIKFRVHNWHWPLETLDFADCRTPFLLNFALAY